MMMKNSSLVNKDLLLLKVLFLKFDHQITELGAKNLQTEI